MTIHDAILQIKKVKKYDEESLSLTNFKLDEIPEEIISLKNIKTLDLRYNNFSVFPPEIFELRQLEELFLGNNNIKTIPSDIKKLNNLKRLHISYNSISEFPNELSLLNNLEILTVEENFLSEFPVQVFNFPRLIILNLRQNRLTEIPSEIKSFNNLKLLSCSGNQIKEIPNEIQFLINLETLNLSNNRIKEIPQIICFLHKLRILYLGDNLLDSIPSCISELKDLKILNLSGNKLYTLPKEMMDLKKLEEIDFRDNLINLPFEISDNIKSPYRVLEFLFSNQIDIQKDKNKKIEIQDTNLSSQEVLEIINDAKEMEINYLTLNNNNIKILPPEIGSIQSLINLDLALNNITNLPPEIGKLKNLRQLSLNSNKLTSLPHEIGNLNKLSWFFCRNNQLSTLPKEIAKLTSLRGLYLENNHIRELPLELLEMKALERFDINGNDISIPSEITADSKQAQRIFSYYKDFLQEQTLPLNEAKVLIVGQGEVGKTSLMKRLTGNSFNPFENKTEGINVKRWLVKHHDTQIRLNIWDFGGQEIMHATHQFFLTKRSLYILVLDSRIDEQENRVEYWLKIIQSFGGDSPVILVCNKCDQHSFDLNWSGLTKKYPSIKNIIKRVSCKTGEGIRELKAIIKSEVANLKHISDKLMLSWFSVKEQLEQLDKNYISYGEYKTICEDQHILDDTKQQILIGLLHDLGAILHFHDQPILEDTNVLNPEWVTIGVYQILNSNLLFRNKGELDREDLNKILDTKKYPRNKHQFIIDMMRNFELCFDFEGYIGQKYLIPDLLSKEEPDTGEWSDSLAFQYHYDVLPNSVISRFIVRMHSYISRRTYWRNGVVLVSENQKNRALVKADIEDKKILIHVNGKKETRRVFLAIIRSNFRSIHATIPKIEVREKVSIPDAPEIVTDYQHLIYLEEKGVSAFIPEGHTEVINVKTLLDGLESERIRPSKSDKIINSPIYNIHTEKLTMGDSVNVNSKGDVAFAKDQGISAIDNTCETMIQTINRTILDSIAGDSDKEDAFDHLKKIKKEFEKSHPDRKRLKRLWSWIVDAIPEAVGSISWDYYMEKILNEKAL